MGMLLTTSKFGPLLLPEDNPANDRFHRYQSFQDSSGLCIFSTLFTGKTLNFFILSPSTKHILVIRLSAMGDCALAVPVILQLQKTYPEVSISVLTKPFFKPIFENIPHITITEADTKGRHKGLWGVVKLAFQLQKKGYTHLADIHAVLRSKIIRNILMASGIKTAQIDKGRADKKALTRADNKIFKPLKTTPERYAEVFKELGFNIDLTHPATLPRLAMSPGLQGVIGNGIQKLIGFAPFAAHQPKTYPLDLTEKLISRLSANKNYKLLLFGGGQTETHLLRRLSDTHPDTVCIAGRLDFAEEIRLISQLDLMLSMDSGNGHLAAMFGIPVITLWGATHPYAGFAPFQQPEENQFIPDLKAFPLLPTSVFGNKAVPGYEDVMRTIKPEDITCRINEILQ